MKILIFSVLLLFCLFSNLSYSQTIERLPCVDKKFCVAVHIINDSLGNPNITEQVVQKGFDTLNYFFKPICIGFDICEFIYHDNHKYDSLNSQELMEWDEMQVLYNKKNVINMYFVNVIEKPSGVCGFASLGGIGTFDSQGIVIQKSNNCCDAPYKTIVHEVGHYFSLEHTFMDATTTELVNGSNSLTTADNITDTPADPYVFPEPVTGYVQNCRFISMKKDANGQYYSPIVGNVMDYYPDECLCGFTHDQYMQMATYYLNNKGMW